MLAVGWPANIREVVVEDVKTIPAPAAAGLGQPSYVWRFGLERRLDLIRRHVSLEGRHILDIGCGIGTFVQRLREFSPHVYGVDVDQERVRKGATALPHLVVAVSEQLPFADGAFDVVLLHEVLEHVNDDRVCVAEMVRVIQAAGRIVIFVPNRLYPFETHGIFWRGKYRFGNVPLVNWLPASLRGRLAPHVRAYTGRGLRRLFDGLPVRVVYHTVIFPGYDNIVARAPILGRILRAITYALERTPLKAFGLSHLLVVEKRDA